MSDYNKILDRAAKLCSSGEKCRHDIEVKMTGWGMKENDVDKALAYLEKNGFIDDQRFASYFVRDKLKFNNWGRIKISFALKQKRVSAEIIQSSLNMLDQDEYEAVLDKILLSKARSLGKVKSYENKAKMLRFAAQRGFLTDEIYKSLDRIEEK